MLVYVYVCPEQLWLGLAGDGAGVLHIMDLPRSLRRRVPSEVNTMHAFLSRQLARLDYLQACKPRRALLLKVPATSPAVIIACTTSFANSVTTLEGASAN